MVYDYTDRFSPLLAPDFFEEYEDFKKNLALKAIELMGQSKEITAPKWTDEGDFYKLELSFDATDNSNILVSEINGTVDFEPQADDIRSIYIEETETIEQSPFKNNIDNVPESKVIEYFSKNLVDKKYLSKEALDSYLKQAFELKTPPTQKFSFENFPTQAKIRKVFYGYFSTTAGKPSGRKLEYVKLLGEYFNGFETSKIESNFSK